MLSKMDKKYLSKEFKPIQISAVETNATDIYVKSFVIRNKNLICEGKIHSACSDEQEDALEFTLTMKEIDVVNAITIEEYNEMEFDFQGPFVEMVDNTGIEKEWRTFIFVTHDWACVIVCKDYDLTIQN